MEISGAGPTHSQASSSSVIVQSQSKSEDTVGLASIASDVQQTQVQPAQLPATPHSHQTAPQSSQSLSIQQSLLAQQPSSSSASSPVVTAQFGRNCNGTSKCFVYIYFVCFVSVVFVAQFNWESELLTSAIRQLQIYDLRWPLPSTQGPSVTSVTSFGRDEFIHMVVPRCKENTTHMSCSFAIWNWSRIIIWLNINSNGGAKLTGQTSSWEHLCRNKSYYRIETIVVNVSVCPCLLFLSLFATCTGARVHGRPTATTVIDAVTVCFIS